MKLSSRFPSGRRAALLIAVYAAALCACGPRVDPEVEARLAAYDSMMSELPRRFYEPGLGDLMQTLQLRHAKLWFAGAAGNWELAAFEVHEIEENLERIARWHADSEDIATGPAIKVHMQSGRYAIEQSIARQDSKDFAVAFDRFTQGCNACHRATKHGFIVIRRPAREPVSNQQWEPSTATAGGR